MHTRTTRTRVTGLILPNGWKDRKVTRVYLASDDDQAFQVIPSGQGRRLPPHCFRVAEVVGDVIDKDAVRYLEVASFNILKDFNEEELQ